MQDHIREAVNQLEATARWIRWLLLDAGVVTAAAAVALAVSSRLAFGLGLGAALLLLAAYSVRGRRQELISRLALHADAYVIPEVARYGAHAAAPAQLAWLSDWLGEAVDSAGEEFWYAQDRVLIYRDEIATLAAELRAPDILVSPQSAVECRRMLTRMVESPLYNYRLPPENLRATIFRIRAGIDRTPRTPLPR
jgi:hypothetical protein